MSEIFHRTGRSCSSLVIMGALACTLLGFLTSCRDGSRTEIERPHMTTPALPSGWQARKTVPPDSNLDDPPQPADPTRILLYGMQEPELQHTLNYCHYTLYDLPAHTPVAEIVSFFAVGSHCAESNGNGADENVRAVAKVATEIARIVPARVFFADAAGLKMHFLRRVTDQDLDQLEALFPADIAMQLGLEIYVSSWTGEGRMLAPVKEQGMIHLWWD